MSLVKDSRSPSVLPTVASTERSGKFLGADDVDVLVGLVPYRDAYVGSNKYKCLLISLMATDLGWVHILLVLHSHFVLYKNCSGTIAQ